MSSIERLRHVGLQITTQLPLYKAIPIAKYRDYAAIRFMNRTDPSRIPTYLSNVNRIPDWRASSLVASAKALLANGEDDKARAFALRAIDIDPASTEAWLVLSDLEAYCGNYTAAYRHASDAWLLEPEFHTAAIKTLRLAYMTNDSQAADDMANLALRRFPHSTRLLWTACKHCRSREQLSQIRHLWLHQSDDPRHISLGARPLALGALHLELYELAMDIYAEACLIELRGLGIGSEVKEKCLEGKNGLSVLQDLRGVLESQGVPFFFAAGTALGIVRDGRPLDHDDDIDLGIFQEYWDRERLIDAFRSHRHFMIEPTMTEKSKIRLTHRGGAGIDIFRFYHEGKNVFHDGNFIRWKNSPFDIRRHEANDGLILYLPSDTNRYLSENYGDWRTPNRYFDAFIDGPNAEVTCEPYLHVHRLRRAYKFIRAGDITHASKELEHVESPLSSTESGRMLIREISR